MDNIQLFVPTFSIDECLAEIKECLEVGWTGLGFKTLKFEEAWKNYTGLSNAYFVNSATIGLQLALKIYKDELGWKNDDEVISTPLTFVSTNHAILYENLKPVFADVDDTLCIDPKSIEEKITSKTRAIMYVGMGGNPGRLDEVKNICSKHGLILILDAAHMSGTYYYDKHVGQEADCSVFSFQAVKNLPTGDSGMVCFKDRELDNKVRKYGWLGISQDTFARTSQGNKGNYKWMYDVDYLGLKAHGNSIIAAIGIVQLKYLDADNKRRRELCSIYQEQLANITNIQFVEYLRNTVPSRHLFQILVPQEFRNELIMYLNSKNIFPGVHYRANTHYKMYKYAFGTCPKAELAGEKVVSLPLHMRLTDDDIERVTTVIKEFFKK